MIGRLQPGRDAQLRKEGAILVQAECPHYELHRLLHLVFLEI